MYRPPLAVTQSHICDALNTTVAGYKYLLTIIDTFTKWVIAVPTRSKEAHVVGHYSLNMDVQLQYTRIKAPSLLT
jgi:hypothetical protein